MKPLAGTLAGLFIASAAFAQGEPRARPATPPGPPPTSEKNRKVLDQYLQGWEGRMAKIDGLETKCVLTEIDEAGRKIVRTGDASLLKPNYSKLLLKLADDPANAKKWVHFVADGKFLRQYDYTQRLVLADHLPKEGVGDNPMMSFLFMTRATDLKKRYDMAIDIDDPKRFTENYVYIDVRPKTRDDMVEFKKARVVLWKNTTDEKYFDRWMLPAQLWFQKPNGEQIIWEFQDLTTKKRLLPRDFEAPAPPTKEWKAERMHPQAATVTPRSAPGK
jgi:TIGR03009 family protein